MNQTKKNFKIKKILNNSSLIVQDLYKEYVLIGKGIGFGLIANDTLPKGTVYTRVYKSTVGINQFSNLISGYEDDIVSIVMDTIQLIVEYDNDQLQAEDLLSISDHLAAAYTRINKGQPIQSFFSYEIKALYPESFEKSNRICEQIEARYKIKIPIAEISYIALHIQNLSSKENKKNVENLNIIISEIQILLTEKYNFQIIPEDINYLRFITHLRFLVEGATQNKRPLNQNINITLSNTYPKYTKITSEIVDIITNTLDIPLFKEENIYLVLHLVNILDEPNE